MNGNKFSLKIKRLITWQRLQQGAQSALLWLLFYWVISAVVDGYRRPSLPDDVGVRLDVAGNRVDLWQMSDEKPLMLYFWAEWCGVCGVTSPMVQSLHDDGYPVLGVALQSGADHEVRDYLAQSALGFPSLNDPDGQFSEQWRVFATPTMIFVHKGKIIHHTTGFSSVWGLKLRYGWSRWLGH